MFMDDAMWLTVTNISLGIVVLVACIVVGNVFARELYIKFHIKPKITPHEMFVDDLGMLYADGGEEMKTEELKDYHL